MVADGGADGLDVVHDTGRGLGVLDENALQAGLERSLHVCGLRDLAPFVFKKFDVEPVRFADLHEPRAEVSDGYDEHLVAGREAVHDRGFHPAGAGGRERQDVVARLEGPLKALGYFAENVPEAGPAVIDDR